MIPYALTIFLSAFLLFQVQPLIAKIILPWFGGAASVWTTCMLFFQVLLLAGYLYSHWMVSKLTPRWQARVHLTLLFASVLTLPILPGASWKPATPDDPALRILGLLTVTVGLPYLLLSTTGPLVQAWFTRDARNQGASPYRLYALSNTGSMLALLSYPFLIEPVISSRAQASAWSAAYVAFVVLCASTAWRSTASQVISLNLNHATPAPGWRRVLVWTALAGCASSFLLTITNHLSQNIASIPFLWILPLSVYLLSFILCFDTRGWYQRKFFLYLFAVTMGTMAYAMSAESGNLPMQVGLPIFGIGLFVACMVCHGELVRLKPDPQHLTAFYAATALGGAAGGIFVGVVAPNVFPGYFELPLTISAASALILIVVRHDPSLPLYEAGLSFEWLLLLVLNMGLNLYLIDSIGVSFGGSQLAVRNFYGGMRVDQEDEGEGVKRKLTHGTINHGEQYMEQGRRSIPVTYYGFDSGVGRTLLHVNRLRPLRVGVIGLGTGTLATYGKAGDRYTFYEINPIVADIARKYFFYISESKATVNIVLGDARLSMEREQLQGFDVLVVDAFSSDSIPVHLLTREAFELYFRHLKTDGILAVHVSNRYLDLKPVVFRLANVLGKEVRVVDTDDDPSDDAIFGATWMLVTADKAFFERPAIKKVAEEFKPKRTPPTWTDDYSNLYTILK